MFINEQETARTRARYQRISPLYDAMELLAERRYASWRPYLWSLVEGPKVLEVGVGTGKNIPYYPADLDITAIDLTPGMLDRATALATKTEADVKLQLGDVQKLDFPDETFDEAVATFVFCSVPDPVLGFNEIARVLIGAGDTAEVEVHWLNETVRRDGLIRGHETTVRCADGRRPIVELTATE